MFVNKLFRFCRWALGIFFVSSLLSVIALRLVPVYVTPLMVIRCVEQWSRGERLRLYHSWVPLEEMPPSLPVAVIASEDQKFYVHSGFDTQAIGNALVQRMEGGRRLGGSTISQQTAKNVFLWPTSSWVRKGFEAYFTVLIELFWSKQRIMEVYLNSIEMGDGIYGVKAVAEQHFDCEPSQLTRRNCALIAATLPAPLRFSSKTPGPYMRSRTRWILNQMRHVPSFDMGQH